MLMLNLRSSPTVLPFPTLLLLPTPSRGPEVQHQQQLPLAIITLLAQQQLPLAIITLLAQQQLPLAIITLPPTTESPVAVLNQLPPATEQPVSVPRLLKL